MMKHTLALALILLLLAPAHVRSRAEASDAPARPAATAPAPEDVLGFRPGDDRKLASWAQVVDYFRRLDAASPRVKFEELGKTTLGAPFVLATISAPETIERDRKSTRLNSSQRQYLVCRLLLEKKKTNKSP